MLKEVCNLTKSNETNVIDKIETLQEDIKKLTKEKEALQQKISNQKVKDLLSNVKEISGVQVLTSVVEAEDMNHLKQIVDDAKNKLDNYVIAFAAINNNKVNFVVAVDKKLTTKYQAGKLVNEIATICGGRGGGRPEMAQAGAKDQTKVNVAFAKLEELIRE